MLMINPNSHRFAIDGLEYLWVLGTRKDSIHGEGESDVRFARYGSLEKNVKGQTNVELKRLTCKDGNSRTILRNKTCGVSTCRQDKDRACALLRSSCHRCDCYSLHSLSWPNLNGPELIIKGRVADGRLGQKTRLSHHEDCTV